MTNNPTAPANENDSESLSYDCDALFPLLAAHALGEGALDQAARSHLAACPTCLRALDSYKAVARILPLAAPDAAPAPELRERLIAAVSGEAAPRRAAEAPAERRAAPQGRPLVRLWGALAGALVLLVALLGWNIALRAQVDTQAAQLANSRETWQTLVVLLNDPSVESVAIAGEQAHGKLWATPEGTVGCLMAEDLPPLAAGQVYQVWLGRDGAWVSAGLFEPRDGKSWFLLRPAAPLASYDGVLVTAEARGGVSAPSGAAVLSVDLGSLRASASLG